MMCKIILTTKNGDKKETEKKDYEGFVTKPASWEFLEWKFNELAEPFTTKSLRSDIISIVKDLENQQVVALTDLLSQVNDK